MGLELDLMRTGLRAVYAALNAKEEHAKEEPVGKILGVNDRWYPAQRPTTEDGRTGVIVVLVEGSIGDYAAYAGCGDPEWVARCGDKISFTEACCHFPDGQLDEERYRV